MRASDRRQNMRCASTTQAKATASCGGITKPTRSSEGAAPAAPTSSSKPRGAWHFGPVRDGPHRHLCGNQISDVPAKVRAIILRITELTA